MKVDVKYPNPPIVEAVCEFIFENLIQDAFDTNTDATNQALKTFRERFPHQENIPSFGVIFDTQTKTTIPVSEKISQFAAEDRKTLVRIDKNKLSIHQLKPYKKWEPHFFPCIQEAFSAVLGVCSPGKIVRLGLRYLNQIDIKDRDLILSKYFHGISGIKIEGYGSEIGFQATTQRLVNKEDATNLRLTLVENPNASTLETEEHKLVLDIDLFSSLMRESHTEDYIQWLSVSRDLAKKLFESLVSEETKRLFQ